MKKPALLTAAMSALLLLALPYGATSAQTTAMAMPAVWGQGANGYGKTSDFDGGYILEDVYSHGFYCDTSIASKAASGCEVGAAFQKPPAKQFDPLYITVPLGFTVPPMAMQCPSALICIDHPATIDLSLIGGPSSTMTPGHDHFTTTTNGFMPEWWNVEVVGVTSRATYYAISTHRSFQYIQSLIAKGDKTVTKPIPTNLFLYFAVRPPQ